MKNPTANQVILSIQSAVMHGAVGNDAAMPIYQHLKQPAERLDTVRLAAHPGFGTNAVSVTPADELAALLDDYRKLTVFNRLGAIQTGYFGHHTQVQTVAKFIAASQDERAARLYLLDPVLGDAGRLYVDEAIAQAMRQDLLPLADIITPNQFELGLLTDTKINDEKDAIKAARNLLNDRLQTVLVTGVTLKAGLIGDILIRPDAEHIITQTKQPHSVSGSGDCLCAIFLSAFLNGVDLIEAAKHASQKTAQVLAQAETPLSLPILESIWKES